MTSTELESLIDGYKNGTVLHQDGDVLTRAVMEELTIADNADRALIIHLSAAEQSVDGGQTWTATPSIDRFVIAISLLHEGIDENTLAAIAPANGKFLLRHPT